MKTGKDVVFVDAPIPCAECIKNNFLYGSSAPICEDCFKNFHHALIGAIINKIEKEKNNDAR